MAIKITDPAKSGRLLRLRVDQLRASQSNPRRLFDAEPLSALKESIETHGVLVPLTVYKLPGQDKYGIIDGERRFRCCQELADDDPGISSPVNVVSPPDEMARLIYMFNIHQFREQWELMPTARALQSIMKNLESDDPETLREVTGLSTQQVERCLLILSYPEKYQALSMEGDRSKRIPSNFWVELHPVLGLIENLLPDIMNEIGREKIIDGIVEKYRTRRVRSVIHFRRIMEANEVQEDQQGREEFVDQLRSYILEPELETRATFDRFISDSRRVTKAVDASAAFIKAMEAAKLSYASESRDDIGRQST